VTDTHEQTLPVAVEPDAPAGTGAATRGRARRGSLTSMLLPELQQVAAGLGISTAKVKKSDLVAAIQAAQSSRTGATTTTNDSNPAERAASAGPADAAPPADKPARRERTPRRGNASVNQPALDASADGPAGAERTATTVSTSTDSFSTDSALTGSGRTSPNAADIAPVTGDNAAGTSSDAGARDLDRARRDGERPRRDNDGGRDGGRESARDNGRDTARNNGRGQAGQRPAQGSGPATEGGGSAQDGGPNQQRQSGDDEDFDGTRRRGRRYRDRRGRNRERQGGGPSGGSGQGGLDHEPSVTDDDVLLPVAGVVDCVEDKNTWFVRVEGFFASPDDVYVANSFVRKFGLRRGDAVTGAVRQSREGERREKYNPLVRLDTVNNDDPDKARNRVEFTKLTPLYPQERLRLETEPHILTTRVIDLVMPIGKGQRALIVSPPKAGKTMVLQSLANAIATNNPECHLMVVLIDERPEEVTDMQRSVKGEVIASTFDRKPIDHTTVAELSIERAKRLVEMGHDVVVLLDSITRLGRAYNLAAPASGRILSGGVDSTALYPPKRFLGAARNIENGGSLTIIATALVETGSAGDTVIFEEFKGTGNAELKLDRKIADKRVFPAVDVDQSSTRKEELLLSPDELAVTIKLRRVLHALEPQQAIDLLLDRLRKSRTNIEFLMQIAKTAPGQD
jgi:transcription termination factor Rho